MHGSIMQLGYVVGDLSTICAIWTERLGAGPFLHMPDVAFEGWTFRGVPQPLKLSIGFAQLGDKMIELIQPHGPWPNIYGDAPLPPGACRPHHHAFLVKDLDAAGEALAAGPPVTRATVGEGAELRYHDCRDALGLYVELITDSPATRAFFDLAVTARAHWDGGGPSLRPIPLMPEIDARGDCR